MELQVRKKNEESQDRGKGLGEEEEKPRERREEGGGRRERRCPKDPQGRRGRLGNQEGHATRHLRFSGISWAGLGGDRRPQQVQAGQC